MTCAHCGFTAAGDTWDHVCTLACLDWMLNLQPRARPVNFSEVTRCYDYALALQVGGSHLPGLRQAERIS